MRSAFDASSSDSLSSWNGTSPRCSESIFDETTSRITISWPSSAKHAPVTRPTQPAPKMPTLLIRAETYLTDVRGLRPFAMEIIVSLDNESRSVLITQ